MVDMLIGNSSNEETRNNASVEFSLSKPVRFWLMVISEIPSVTCSLILLYYLLFDAALRKSIHNHVIIALLIVGLFSQLIDNPSYLNHMRTGSVWPRVSLSCVLWWFSATSISNITNLLMAWGSIEQHILVFHDRWLRTSTQRFRIHYLPLGLLTFYGFTYYIIILSIYSCENMYAFTTDWCLYPCYYNNERLALFDTIVNSILPTPTIALFSVAMVFRVIRQKRSLHRRVRWRKCRRMILQLLSVSALFLVFNLPMTSLVLAQICGLPRGSTGQFELYTYYLYHFVSLLIPFVCLNSFPEIRKKIKHWMILSKTSNIIGTVNHAIH